jgi:hypothetical protein
MPYLTVTAPLSQMIRRFILFLLAVTFVFLSILPAPGKAEAANCQFVLGFKILHDLIPAITGDCLTNETHNPTNGDGLQLTTRGLLVWRKADNFTAFTDGHQTWVNGPFGLQTRLNTARFPWEPDVAPANVDPRLSVAYRIAASSRFANLIANAVARKIPVRVAALSGAFGAFSINRQTGRQVILIEPALLDANPNDAAAVLIHEATHAFDFTHQPNFSTTQGCFQTEFRAKTNDLTFWRDQFGPDGKQPALNAFEQEENAQLALAQVDLQALLFATFNAYRTECGL